MIKTAPGVYTLTVSATAVTNELDALVFTPTVGTSTFTLSDLSSANATPKDAVAAMRQGCVGMCSTQIGAYNQVPREPLLQALSTRMQGKLARSDQVAVKGAGPNSAAGSLPKAFDEPTGELFIDYDF